MKAKKKTVRRSRKKQVSSGEPYVYQAKDWDEKKSVVVEPDHGLKQFATSIRLPFSMVQRLRKIAQKKGGIPYQTLLKLWIAEKLIEEERSA